MPGLWVGKLFEESRNGRFLVVVFFVFFFFRLEEHTKIAETKYLREVRGGKQNFWMKVSDLSVEGLALL